MPVAVSESTTAIDTLSLEETIRIHGQDYSMKSLRTEIEHKFALLQSLSARVRLLHDGALLRVRDLTRLRIKMEDALSANMVEKRLLREMYEAVEASEADARLIADSIKNHEENTVNFLNDVSGLVDTILTLLNPELNKQIPN